MARSLAALCIAGISPGAAPAQTFGHAAYRVNGVRFDVVTLRLAGDPHRIAEALAADWQAETSGRGRPRQHGRRWIIGRQRGSLHETVELRAGPGPGTVDGRVSVVDLASPPTAPLVPPFVMPAGLRTLQVIEPVGSVAQPAVFLIASRLGVAATWARVERALDDAGFRASARGLATRGEAAGSWIFEARSAHGSVEGVIRPKATGAGVVLVHRGDPAEAADARR